MVDVSDIITAARAPKKGGHSPLYWWMWKHYADVSDELSHRANYAEMAERFRGHGMTDGRGNPVSARTVAETWRKVDRRKREGRKLRKPRERRSALRRDFGKVRAGRT